MTQVKDQNKLYFANELPPRQKAVYQAALTIVGAGKQITMKEIAKIVEGNDDRVSINRMFGLAEVLKKKNLWTFEEKNGKSPTKPFSFTHEDMKHISLIPNNPSSSYKKPESPPSVDMQLSMCNLHDSPENSLHDFGIKIMESFSKLSRDHQAKLWDDVGNLLNKTMKTTK